MPTDSGVTARLFGTFLTWLNDRDQRQLRDLHLQRHRQAAAGVQPQRAVRRRSGSWICPAAQQKDAIWDIYLKMFELDPRAAAAQGRAVDGCGDPGLLPPGSACGRAADGGRPERRAGGRYGCRERRAAAAVGVGAVPRCRRPAASTSANGARHAREAGPQGPATGPVEQRQCHRLDTVRTPVSVKR